MSGSVRKDYRRAEFCFHHSVMSLLKENTYVYRCFAYMCVCAPRVRLVLEKCQKKVLDALGMELEMGSVRAARVLNY